MKAAEILADDDSSQDDWVKEMLHRIEPEELERKRKEEVIVGDSMQGPLDDVDDSLSQLFTAFNKYGCSRGPLTACALSELERSPHHLSLERIVQCIKVIEGHTKSGKHQTIHSSLPCSPFLCNASDRLTYRIFESRRGFIRLACGGSGPIHFCTAVPRLVAFTISSRFPD